MKKIGNLLILALLTIGMGLTSCDEQLDNAVVPGAAAAAKTLAEATAGDIGKIVGADGKIYATKADAEAVATGNAVAMIAYVGSETGVADYTHGLALALTDEAEKMNWSTATGASGAAAHTPAAPTPMTSSWMLPSRDQWNKMIDAAGGYDALRNGFSVIAGASNLQSGDYWSSTEYNSISARYYDFGSGDWVIGKKDRECQVRACLAF